MTVHGGPPAGSEERWRDPAWLAQASRWIDERLTEQGVERTGAIEQPHVYPWSTVLRLPSTAGTLWFKANTQALRHEVTVVATVAARRPDLVPPLLAADVVTGWMLMADAGSRLREIVAREASLHRWHEVLGRYAGLQLDLAEQVPALLAAGVPDLRLHRLPQAYGLLLDGLEERQGTAGVARVPFGNVHCGPAV